MSDDLYIVLPSNACTDIHPNNNASKYIISWENPIEFNPSAVQQWKVALMEINFNYIQKSLNANFGFQYTKMAVNTYTDEFSLGFQDLYAIYIHFKTFPTPLHPPYDNFEQLQITIIDNKLSFQSKHEFSITFTNANDANVCGFTKTDQNKAVFNDKLYTLTSTHEILYQSPEDLRIVDHIFANYTSHPWPETFKHYFSDEKLWNSVQAMMRNMITELKHIFDAMKYDEKTQLITLSMKPDIVSVKFLNGFNMILGFEQMKLKNDTQGKARFTGKYTPYLKGGINNMYIYSSICQPIQVGSTRVPLLKSIWLDNKKNDGRANFGEVRNITTKNPMYIPISASSINSIEINIRSDSGRLFPFSDGAVTSLTLHFKRV